MKAYGFLLAAALSPLAVTLEVSALPPLADTFAGTRCKPTNYIEADYYEYEAAALINTGTTGWDIFLAACPVEYVHYYTVNGVDPSELQIVFEDPEQRDTYCWFYRTWDDRIVAQDWADWYGSWGYVNLDLNELPGTSPLSFTCLIQPGARLEGYTVFYFN